jgi:hypothetical protein
MIFRIGPNPPVLLAETAETAEVVVAEAEAEAVVVEVEVVEEVVAEEEVLPVVVALPVDLPLWVEVKPLAAKMLRVAAGFLPVVALPVVEKFQVKEVRVETRRETSL